MSVIGHFELSHTKSVHFLTRLKPNDPFFSNFYIIEQTPTFVIPGEEGWEGDRPVLSIWLFRILVKRIWPLQEIN